MGCGSVMGLSQHLEHDVKWSWAGPEVESGWAGLEGGVRPGRYSGVAFAGRDLVSDKIERKRTVRPYYDYHLRDFKSWSRRF